MQKQPVKFWSFHPRYSILISLLLLVVFMVAFFLLRDHRKWPGENVETTVLIGIMLFSLLPVVLAVMDIMIERGGILEFSGWKLDFSTSSGVGAPDFAVPDNIGYPGQPLYDSSTNEILDTLRHATACKIVVIDLKDGKAWWETRLLVLLSGAVRFGQPEIVVFTAKVGQLENCFQGWGYTKEILPLLLKSDPQYPMIYHATLAAARKWAVVQPIGPGILPTLPPDGIPGIALNHPWMAFDIQTGLPNPLYAEQLLAAELGSKIENIGPARWISLSKMDVLFGTALNKTRIEEKKDEDQQVNTFFDQDAEYFAITEQGKYKALASRSALLTAFVKSLVIKKK